VIGLLLSFVSLPLGNAVCWPARASLDVILGVARFGGKLTLTIPAPNVIAYLLWLAAMVFASRLFLKPAKTRALMSALLAELSILCWILF
jgi:hypothetical protein